MIPYLFILFYHIIVTFIKFFAELSRFTLINKISHILLTHRAKNTIIYTYIFCSLPSEGERLFFYFFYFTFVRRNAMVQKLEIFFSPAGENRRIHVYLPNDYDYSQERYPVLYMLDGHNLFFDSDATYGTCLGLKDFIDGWHKKLIVVGIEGSSDDYIRTHEFVPYNLRSHQHGDVKGRGEATMQWIIHELKPKIDKDYRTWPQREATAFAGYSMAGITAVYAVTRHNDVFSKSAVISPSVMIARDPLLKEIQDDTLSPDTRVFFSWGTNEYGPQMDATVERILYELESALMGKGVKTFMFKHWDGRHNEGSWREQVPTWMDFLWL